MDIIGIHANSRPGDAAYIQGDRVLTWKDTFELRNRIANSLLGLGLEESEHVIVYDENTLNLILASAGVTACGGVSVPMNHRLVAEEVAYILDNSDAAMVIVGDRFLPIIEQVRSHAKKVRNWILVGDERKDWAQHVEDLIEDGSPDTDRLRFEGLGGSMIYTSGTTGKPKGARRTFGDPSIALKWLQVFKLDDPNHIHLAAGPLYHSAPAAFAGFNRLAGGATVVMRKFDPEEALRLIEKHRVTTTFMAPILLKRILDLSDEVKSRYDVSSMKVLVVAGAPCPMKVKQEALAYFGPVLYEFYGSTELGINTILEPQDILRKPGSCGKVAPGIEMGFFGEDGKQVPQGEPGEIFIRRYGGMFDEYYKNPDALQESSRGEWVSVGDVAYIDEEGFVFICDRKRDMVISGGVNIYPAEIEEVLHRNPKIADAGVFGVPDDEWGERIHAAVQLKPRESATPEELMVFCRQHLAGYKVPREFSFHEDFPRDNAGKLVKRVLRDPFWEGRTTRV